MPFNFAPGRNNNRNQAAESKINPDNVSSLVPLWTITTGDGPGGARDDISATPAVDGEYVYFPDWSGNLFKADRRTLEVIWKRQISEYTGVSNDFACATPAIDGDLLIFGTQSGQLASAAHVVAVDKNSGDLVWATQADNYFDAVMALDWHTGEVKWSTIAIPFDVWTVGCLDLGLPPQNCPDPEGPDFDFGQAPMLIKAEKGKNKQELLGVGQKSGQFWALNPDTGEVVWVTQVGPGGVVGGLMWGSAFDGDHIYTSSANSERKPWVLADGSSTNSGIWSALDPLTGEIIWQTANPTPFAQAGGAVSSANGVVYACSQDDVGYMYAMDADTGEILWSFASGGACNAGAAVVNGMVYWGSGYDSFGGTGNDKFYAFGLNQ